MPTIEDVILRRDKRGVAALRPALPQDYCTRAAHFMMEHQGRVVIATGFYILSTHAPETDGPPGAIALGRALESLGYLVNYVTDEYTQPLFAAVGVPDSQVVTFPIVSLEESRAQAVRLLMELQPDLLVAIERCGRSQDGRYLNMRGHDISEWTAKLDELFLGHPASVGIGDGGNEIGMGNLYDAVRSAPSLVPEPCTVPTSHLVIAGVSNWGGYGLVAALSRIVGRDLLPSSEEHGHLIRTMAEHGAVDGLNGAPGDSVDGFTLAENLEVLEELRGQRIV